MVRFSLQQDHAAIPLCRNVCDRAPSGKAVKEKSFYFAGKCESIAL
jgi:hypothetical protein